MVVLIDSDVLIRYERGGARPRDLLDGEEPAISVVTASELLHGVYRAKGAQRMRRRAFVEHLLGGLPAVSITDRVARMHAELWADLAGRRKSDRRSRSLDRDYGSRPRHGVVTGNGRDFMRVPGLRVLPIGLA